ncbi:hypothetical protein CANARDRAFT_196055 [[Candida] arabinofermentans NRRL YB-2248]|uniref:Origin recognition complex subunit 4 n=1 Tax=[Candida] arabinofermentans NRRL YB-2248 TaxID=983967 RepID=A0A1E4T4P2_9ASCO|nr:hypothetical protein CANARDRAFT_196055 [[Candida] arabinofermentans NRRL YB-2248]
MTRELEHDCIDETFEKHIKLKVLSNLTNRTTSGTKKIKLYNLENERLEIYKMLENTIRFNEGKSCLLIGPRGSGKTTLINNVIIELTEKYGKSFFIIRLNGLFQDNDKNAVKEIARQLDWQVMDPNVAADATFEKLSVNATMTTIMSLLDRSRLNEDDDEEVEEEEEYDIPIIFLLDEFERYTNSSKQTLLYNLFDIAQVNHSSRTSPIAVIGLTSKTTVREQLEKRVKSRFSQRVIQINKAKNMDEFIEYVKTLLKVEVDDDELNSNGDLQSCLNQYHECIDELISNKGGELRKMIVENYYTIKDLNSLKNSLIPFIMDLKISEFNDKSYKFSRTDFKNESFELLKSISELELQLLICSARQCLKNSLETINFNVSFEEYERLARKQNNTLNSQLQTMGNIKYTTPTSSRDLMLTCWENLIQVGLLIEPTRQTNGINLHFYTGGENNKMYHCDLNLEDIMKYFQSVSGSGNEGSSEYSWVEGWCRL